MITFENDLNTSSLEHKEAFDNLQTQFSKFGIPANQSKVYIYLGKHGSKTAPEICLALRLPRTETYSLLATLQNRGVIKASFQHPIRFSALPIAEAIKSIIDMEKNQVQKLEDKKGDLTEIWDSIPTFHKEPEIKTDDKFQILQGENQIFSKINDMIINTSREFQIIGTEKDFLKFYNANFLESFDKSDIKLKILTDSSERTIYVFDEIDRTKVKKIPKKITSQCCFLIKDSTEVIIYTKHSKLDENIAAFWTNSEVMIYSKKLLFNLLWSRSKSIPL